MPQWLGKSPRSGLRLSRFVFFVFVRQLAECLRHVEKPGFIEGIFDALGKPDAFRGIATVIDGGKWRHTFLQDAAVKPRTGILFRKQISLTKLWKNEVPAEHVAAAYGLRRRLCWSQRNTGNTRRSAFAWRK